MRKIKKNEKVSMVKGGEFVNHLLTELDPLSEKWEKDGIKQYPPPKPGFIPADCGPDPWSPMRHWDD